MLLTEKIQQWGLKWLVRRVVRELIRPTTKLGQLLKPYSTPFYQLISKPGNYLYTRFKKTDIANDTLFFFYDLEIEPVTYDFIWAVCVANAKREALGLTRLHVVLVPGSHHGLRKELPDYEQVVTHEARIWRIYSIILPSIKLLPACGITLCSTREEGIYIREKQAHFVYPEQYNVTFPMAHAPEFATKCGPNVMSLRADTQAKAYVSAWLKSKHGGKEKKLIVITLRDYLYTPERNSNLDAWARFASKLSEEDYFVVFIADTEQALLGIHQELKNFIFFNEACWNLNLRAAIYELAYLNLGVNTGPMLLCWFNPRCRYITFKIAVKNVPEVPLEMITNKGVRPGTNPTFANSLQTWVWDDDNEDIIANEFNLMLRRIEKYA